MKALISLGLNQGLRISVASSVFQGLNACGVSGTLRLKRGAGAGCVTPSISTYVPRALRWGCSGASFKFNTGAKQDSVPS